VGVFSAAFLVYYHCRLLSRRSRQRERLSGSVLSICLSVCLSVCRQNAKKLDFLKEINKQFRAMMTYRKSHIGFSKNPLLDPKIQDG